MRILTFLAVLALVAGCGGGGGSSDPGGQADVTQGDLGPSDPGTPDPGTPDPGKLDPGLLDSGPQDPGKPETTWPEDEGPTDPGPGTDVPVQCPSVVTGTTCAAKVACAIQCADAAYEAACVGAAAEEATQQAQAVLTCLRGLECAPIMEDEWFTDCAAAACEAEIDTCFKGTGICNDVRKCRMGCEASDPACPFRCRALATLEEQDVWEAYYDCIMGADCVEQGDVLPNGWPTDKCELYAQNHYCPKQTQACIPPQ